MRPLITCAASLSIFDKLGAYRAGSTVKRAQLAETWCRRLGRRPNTLLKSCILHNAITTVQQEQLIEADTWLIGSLSRAIGRTGRKQRGHQARGRDYQAAVRGPHDLRDAPAHEAQAVRQQPLQQQLDARGCLRALRQVRAGRWRIGKPWPACWLSHIILW